MFEFLIGVAVGVLVVFLVLVTFGDFTFGDE